MSTSEWKNSKFREISGTFNASGLRFAIVVSRFNEFVTSRLLNGAVDALTRSGAASDDITVVRVPGSFEIPVTAKHLAASGRFHAVICLGAILRGETPHFEYISAEACRGVAAASLESGVPMSFGILTVDTLDQAIDRAGLKSGNKGFEAAMSAIEMANLFQAIRKPSTPSKRK
ncbi:MAG: 6,7-dimethyl-8-ribityllumazine synthase [Acidobacteria bacterium RIFCSPLOWO2_12_FULL_54_10]|nr:MAG: 6,7-dimethyl-8-ribityllumazine synthase [Acidobacteria bacterium RIFCSPLOWO2_12_FULL_54_10]